MYIVTVIFVVKSEFTGQFRTRMQKQAADSLTYETGCHQFDVCVDPQSKERIFLYEVYTDEAAFKAHLASNHFKAFEQDVADWVQHKEVNAYNRLKTAGHTAAASGGLP